MNNTVVKQMTWEQFSHSFCERQDQTTPDGLKLVLRDQKSKYHPDGWMLLECQMMDSSRLGEYTILPYGPNNTYKTIPEHPVSPRGLCSDMSIVAGVLLTSDLP